jgi:hypothetical protein
VFSQHLHVCIVVLVAAAAACRRRRRRRRRPHRDDRLQMRLPHCMSSPGLSQLDIAPCILRLHVVGECLLACQTVALEVDVGESWGLAQLDGDWA